MSAAVGLQVQPPYVNGANFGDGRRQQVDFGANQVGMGVGSGAGHKIDGDVAGGGHLGVDAGFHFAGEFGGHILQLKVHPRRAGAHIASGDQGAVVAPDHAAEDVQGGVGSHQQVAPFPVDDAAQGVAGGRPAGAVQGMDDGAAGAGHFRHPVLRAGGGGVRQPSGVAGLPAAANVKGGAIENHAAIGVDGGHHGIKFGLVSIGLEQQFGHSGLAPCDWQVDGGAARRLRQ